MKKLFVLASLLAIASLMFSACGSSKPTDLLGAIKERGYILAATDLNYAPVSATNPDGRRPGDTKCPVDAITAAEMIGFDVDVAKAIGDGLGVETCFTAPGWDSIIAGNWADKWDISVGSMTINTKRQEILNFSVPYYYTPAVVVVLQNSPFKSLDDLKGQKLCTGASTTFEFWGKNDMAGLGLPDSSIYFKPPEGMTIVTLDTEQACAKVISSGSDEFVGYVTSMTILNENLAEGLPVEQLGKVVYSEDLAAAFDKASSLNTDTLRAEVDRVFTEMHRNGKLSELSIKWFGMDLTQAPNQ
jgi:polar amino acid transport system substrate-binding protein